MHKARIEIGPALIVVISTEMPERVDPVRVIEMRIDTEDLAKACAAVIKKCLWEASALAKPVAASQGRKRRLKIGRSNGEWSFTGWCTEPTRSERSSIASNSRRIDRERFRVMNLPIHPSLDQRDVLWSRDRDWLFFVIKPGIGMTVLQSEAKYDRELGR